MTSTGSKRWGCTAQIKLEIRGPILVHGNQIGPLGVDAIAMRDSDGSLVIPGDAVLGKLREAFDEIGKADCFGRSRAEDTQFAIDNTDKSTHDETFLANLTAENNPYPLFVSDFVSSTEELHAAGQRTLASVKMDEETGAATEKMLRFLDCPVDPGKPVSFCGTIRFLAISKDSAAQSLKQIQTALRWIEYFGSNGTVGFGKLMRVSTEHEVIEDLAETLKKSAKSIDPRNLTSEGLMLDFELLDLLCVPSGLINKNIYESRDEIPGEVLKGSMAAFLQTILGGSRTDSLELLADPTKSKSEGLKPFEFLLPLIKRFSNLRITTARPTKAFKVVPVNEESGNKGSLSGVIPFSTAEAHGKLFDFVPTALLESTSRHDSSVGTPLFDNAAAAFAPDWKGDRWQAANEVFGVEFPRQELRVRTAMDSTLRRAKTNNLFAYRCVGTKAHYWRNTINVVASNIVSSDTPDDTDQSALKLAIALLQSGWLSVGKMRSRTKCIAWRPIENVAQDLSKPVILMLRSPTLMIDPRCCVNEKGNMRSIEEYDSLIAKYWEEISGGLFCEQPHGRFWQTDLIGGFQAYRYRYSPETRYDLSNAGDANKQVEKQKTFAYQPTMVALAGSVFVLRLKANANEDENRNAQACLKSWLTQGLPLPDWARQAYGETHRTNIFLPTNGFGEIALNQDCHNSSFEHPLKAVGKQLNTDALSGETVALADTQEVLA